MKPRTVIKLYEDTINDGAAMNPVGTVIKPYGDTINDGAVQLSFTLPVSLDETAREAARVLAEQMGMAEAQVAFSQDLGQGFSFFVVYGHCTHTVDLAEIHVDKAEFTVLKKSQIDALIKEKFGRKLTLVGACIESDAHTVGIDAIMNMKGYNGHKGLESYHEINALNLGAQISSEELAARAIESGADAILVSQVVTQKNVHLANLTRLADILEAEGLREKIILVVGGPRITHELAKELGYDAGFGPNTYAEDVASFVVQEMLKRGDE